MINWPSPAKINLFLHITGRREDGYHDLQTAFQFLEHSDTLQFEITEETNIQLLTPFDGVEPKDNLIVRAAELLQQYSSNKKGARIQINKVLPMGGGLGGGSSNAATTLVALNHLWQVGLSEQKLAELGLQLGADVPIFIAGYAAWAEGVGEALTAIKPKEPWYLVVVPDCHVSTKEIFSSEELTRDCIPITIAGFLAGEGTNICEAVVKKYYPPVAQAMDWLAQYASPKMTGTGACVFAGFDEETQAQRVFESLPVGWQGFVAKGTNLSPLVALLRRLQASDIVAE